MVDVTIPDEATEVAFDASSAGPHAFTFTYFDKADLHVSIDGVELAQSGFSHTPGTTQTGGYRGGSITLNAAVSGGAGRVWRVVETTRTDNYSAGPLSVQTISRDLSRIVAMAQDARRDIGRWQELDQAIVSDALAAVVEANTLAAARIALGVGNVGAIDQYKLPGYTDTHALLGWLASGDAICRLTRDVTITQQIDIADFCYLDAGGHTIFKGFNGDMFTMGQYARILNARIDGVGATYSGRGIYISGGSAKMHQALINVDMINTRDYNLEFSGDFSGLGFQWIGGSFFRYDPTLDAIKLPDTEAATSGLRCFAFLSGNGSAMMDVAGGRVTTIKACNAISITLRNASAYLLMDESRVVQIIDRIAVTGATRANPCVVTAPGHGLRNGDSVTFYDVGGMAELNGVNFTVANKTTDTIELSGTDSSSFGAYTSGGVLKNRSAHVIRGSNHQIQGIQGTTLDGSTVVRLAPAAASNLIDIHPGQSLQDDSGVTSNGVLSWTDKILWRTNGTLRLNPGADGIDILSVLNGVNARWALHSLAAAGGLKVITQNGGIIRLSPNEVDALDVSENAVTLLKPLISPTATPASAVATGASGQWAWDANYIYICTATNTWKRIGVATW